MQAADDLDLAALRAHRRPGFVDQDKAQPLQEEPEQDADLGFFRDQDSRVKLGWLQHRKRQCNADSREIGRQTAQKREIGLVKAAAQLLQDGSYVVADDPGPGEQRQKPFESGVQDYDKDGEYDLDQPL